MRKTFIVDNESKESYILLKYLGVTALKAPNTETNFVLAQEVAELLANNYVACEIQMSEVNNCGFIRMLYQGSVIVKIPFHFINVKTSQLEKFQDTDLTMGNDFNKHSEPEITLSEMSDLKNLHIYATQLEKSSLLKSQHSPSASSTQTSKSVDNKSVFPSDSLLNQVFEFINNNYHQAITLCNVAQAVGYSAAYLTDLVRRQTGKTVNHWIIERRMTAARTLLLETNQSANQIAVMVGYQHEGHFFRQFRQHHGTTPQNWRKKQRSEVTIDTETKKLRVS
ncbi:MAG: AraC family transcriptional regulator [Scytonematopsis contorta HA4267-MV1]|jgi:AraC-like DNA-binding protein|nr:AraC family transcriptional regulator [Scytonematopsis contorta HA4267-MV1]